MNILELRALLTPIGGDRGSYERLRHLRNESPLQVSQINGVSYFILYRFEDVQRCLLDGAGFTSEAKSDLFRPVVGSRSVASLDGDEHREYRSGLAPCFSGSNLNHWCNAIIPDVARICVEDLASDTSLGTLDLVERFTSVLPIRVLTAILGVPPELRARFQALCSEIVAMEKDISAGIKALISIRGCISRMMASDNLEPTTLLSELALGIARGAIQKDRVATFIRLLIPAAIETTSRSLGSFFCYLLADHALREQVYERFDLARKLFEEVVRLECPLQVTPRTVERSMDILGLEAPASSIAILHIGSANRDERHFATPDDVILGRKENHLAFGRGPHSCLGAALARAQAIAACRALYESFPDTHLNARVAGSSVDLIEGILSRSPPRLPVQLAL